MTDRIAEVTPALVAEHARRLLARHGLHAVTVEYVAKSLACEPAEVWRAVPDFQALMALVFEETVSEELAEVQRSLEAIPDPTLQLSALIDLLADPVHDEVTAAWVEAFSFSRRNVQLADVVRAEEGRWVGLFAAVIERGVASRAWEAPDPRLFAAQLLAMIDGLNAQALAGYGTGADRRVMLENFVHRELAFTPGGAD